MYVFNLITILFSVLKLSSSSSCHVCLCSVLGGMRVFDCNAKVQNGTNGLKFFLYNDTPDKLILSNNGLTELSVESFKNLKNMKIMDLSHNYLNESSATLFKYWIKLNDFDLSFNNFTTFDFQSLFQMPSLSKFNLSHNHLVNFTVTDSLKYSHLTQLDLSYNKLTTITENQMNIFTSIQYIDLSFNQITSIDINSFTNLHTLKSLMLQNNFIKSLKLNFPISLKTLFISNNELTEFPSNLSVNYLSIDANKISSISINNTNMYRQLEYLNISRNQLSNFVDVRFINLKILDISYNKLSNIPETISAKNLPKLDTLIMSGNPINTLKFNTEVKLRNFVINNLTLLTRINEKAFDYLKEYDNECINMTIAFNENLTIFDEKSLKNLNICYLDLANNALKRISQDMRGLQNESFFKYGLNLQGNPLVCDCASQWMLDYLIPKLYNMNTQLLPDLRCSEPPKLSKTRLVHWYKWKQSIFCDNDRLMLKHDIMENSNAVYIEPESSTIIIESSRSMLLIITICAVLLLLFVIIGMTLSIRLLYKRGRHNRRFYHF